MKLKVLTGGDVRDAVGIFLRQFRQGFELRGVQSAAGNLDALHARSIPQGAAGLWSDRPEG